MYLELKNREKADLKYYQKPDLQTLAGEFGAEFMHSNMEINIIGSTYNTTRTIVEIKLLPRKSKGGKRQRQNC